MSKYKKFFHGSFFPKIDEEGFRPFTHFGTERSASDRIQNTLNYDPKIPEWCRPTIYCVSIDFGNIKKLEVSDWHSPSPFILIQRLAKLPEFSRYNSWLEKWNVEGAPYLYHYPETCNDARFINDKSRIMKEILTNDLIDRGYDAISYPNEHEDINSESIVLLDPDRIKSIQKRTLLISG